jgi:hypothetical protein
MHKRVDTNVLCSQHHDVPCCNAGGGDVNWADDHTAATVTMQLPRVQRRLPSIAVMVRELAMSTLLSSSHRLKVAVC